MHVNNDLKVKLNKTKEETLSLDKDVKQVEQEMEKEKTSYEIQFEDVTRKVNYSNLN